MSISICDFLFNIVLVADIIVVGIYTCVCKMHRYIQYLIVLIYNLPSGINKVLL